MWWDAAARGGTAGDDAPTEQTRRNDAALVGDEKVAWTEVFADVAEMVMGQGAGGAIEDE